MAWYRNFYHCGDCGTSWEDEWSCCCDDECPECGSGDWSPVESEDLSVVVEMHGDKFVILHSPSEVCADRPRYRVIGTLPAALVANALAKALS